MSVAKEKKIIINGWGGIHAQTCGTRTGGWGGCRGRLITHMLVGRGVPFTQSPRYWWSHQRKQAPQSRDAVILEINFDIRGLKFLFPANPCLCLWATCLSFPVMDPACRVLWAQGPSGSGLALNASVHLSTSGRKLKEHRTSSIH